MLLPKLHSAAVEEDNFFGKHPGVEPDPHRYEHIVIKSPKDPNLTTYGWQQSAAGYAAVWATENTREAIFDAMVRKEVYASTGPRMTVRFFGGWEFAKEDALSRKQRFPRRPLAGKAGESATTEPRQ